MNGTGNYFWPDGRSYIGSWIHGFPQGFGIGRNPNGKRYEGEWSEGKKHGLGLSFDIKEASTLQLWESGEEKKQS